MADLILTWYIKGVLSETGVKGSNYGTEYTLDKSYRPIRLIVRMKEAPAFYDEPCTIDINDDGESIFSGDKPIIASSSEIYRGWSNKVMAEDSVITLDIDQISPIISGKDMTIQLDLETA